MFPAQAESRMLLDGIAAIFETMDDDTLFHFRSTLLQGFASFETSAASIFSSRLPSVDWEYMEAKLAVIECMRSWRVFLFMDSPSFLDKSGFMQITLSSSLIIPAFRTKPCSECATNKGVPWSPAFLVEQRHPDLGESS